jgi:hypothetical protein
LPSAQATALSRRHRRELTLITGLAVRRVRELARVADIRDIDGWWDRRAPQIIRLVSQAFTLSRASTTRYLRQHAAVEGFTVDPIAADLSRDRAETSLRVTGPVSFKTHMRTGGSPEASLRTMQTTLTGATQRLVLAGDRETVNDTIAASDVIVGYRRVTSGSACAFCSMLASRGAAYKSSRSVVLTAAGTAYHDHCRCTVVPLYEHEDEPESVQALRDQWDEVTAGLSGTAALSAFRRARSG